ncbi:hypothetical protein [Pelomonas sp. SE-A7]|uniref:hypothetical protein n=1 Tax=Pelomonas sp. SE-A7 TaxID=3054953 RepID=UPI00259C7EDC|nr:hypothetical protein [Pelomonas sp. SE-A7]MDM4767189.1 hypothetical protein [Pelomonas sp. SE-A7]
MRIFALLLTCFSLIFSACGQDQERLIAGGLYSTRDKNGSYSVFKLLKLDSQGVHLRLYSNQFAEHPATLDESKLFIAGMNRKPNETLGMGHAPISRKSFASWGARFIKVVPVKEEELEGYKMWKEADGGYF